MIPRSRQIKISRYLSFILRHHPEAIDLNLDQHGWANVKELIENIQKYRFPELDMDLLEEIVCTDDKQRYTFDAKREHIRANQGHSIQVDVEFEEVIPPDSLWHGTASKSIVSIEKQGLLPQSRLYVHLSKDPQTAYQVGKRHGHPIIYRIDAASMHQDGYLFYLSKNGVYLTKEVPVQYLYRKKE